MKKFYLLFCAMLFITFHIALAQVTGVESRMNEVFKVTELTHPASTSPTKPNTRFYDPWEVTYGPDDSLWITEAKNYKVYKIGLDGTGDPRLVLDISKGSTFFSSTSDQAFNLQFTFSNGGYSGGSAPQGGLAGLAIHPKFLSGSPYVYVSYIWKFVKQLTTANSTTTGSGTTTTTGTPTNGGVYYQNSLVRFTYDFTTHLLKSPVMVCDTLPGSSDHNSQRIIIAPIGTTYYLFYANGDMGAGQFGNSARVENAQNLNSYEGKILRFNVDPDTDPGAYDKWIPSDNPFNGTKQSAVWAYGFRNNQGFAYAKINGTDHLYGQMHGPFSDDEINVIHSGGNYGHPLVVGYKKDGNYNGSAAGNPYTNWTGTYAGTVGGLPVIVNESNNADSMNKFHTYYDPIFTYYPASQGSSASVDVTNTTAVPSEMASVKYMYYWFNQGQQSNTYWPSEAPSGMDIYTSSMIPGWKNSLISSIMKGAPANTSAWKVLTSGGSKGAPTSPSSSTTATGKLLRLKLNANGDGLFVSPTNADSTLKSASAYAVDTISYFASQNRFRDIAISPDGLSLYAIIDSSSTTSGPTATNPANSLCKGCLLKMTFMGYSDNGTTSTLPDTIPVSSITTGSCVAANTITINSSNNNIWVPITDTNSNIIAEINANGNNLGAVTTSYYVNGGTVRETGSNHNLLLDRNITITPATQPSSGSVKVRLYITNAEYTNLKNATNSQGQSSGITAISSLGIFKNHDACGGTFTSSPMALTASNYATRAGSNGYALQTSVSSFSTFYFANNTAPLAVHLLSFTGSLVNSITQLQWVVETESGIKSYVVERSTDGYSYSAIGTVTAKNNNTSTATTYNFPDPSVTKLSCNVVYYRLRIIEVDNHNSLSDVVPINLPGIAGNMSIHPNPVMNIATIDINETVTENVNWQMVDNTGRTIQQKKILLTKGANTFTINVSGLPTGVYYLKVTGTVINQQVKFEKL